MTEYKIRCLVVADIIDHLTPAYSPTICRALPDIIISIPIPPSRFVSIVCTAEHIEVLVQRIDSKRDRWGTPKCEPQSTTLIDYADSAYLTHIRSILTAIPTEATHA